VGFTEFVRRRFSLLRTSCWRALEMSSMTLLYCARSSGMCLIASP
jgi:hypothetical protein